MESRFRIGRWEFAPEVHELRRDGETVRLEPKHAEVLALLATRPGGLVTRDEILAAIWGDVHVTEEVLTNAIWQLRRTFGDDPRRPRFIQTIPRKGYRLVAPVRPVDGAVRARRVAVASAAAALLAIPLAVALLAPSSGAAVAREMSEAEAALEEATVEGAMRAVRHADRALANDPDHAPALAARARARLSLVAAGSVTPALAHPEIERDATRAIRVDPDLAAAHVALGQLRMNEWKWDQAERHLGHAVALDPDSGHARAALAELLLLAGRREEAGAEAGRAAALAPEAPSVLLSAGFVHVMLRDRDAAEAAYRAILRRRPGHAGARQQLEKLDRPFDAGGPLDRSDLLRRIDGLLAKGRVRPAIVAGMFAEAGETEKALEWLRRARDEKDLSLLLVRLDDRWEGLHADPRLRAILAEAAP